MADRTETGSYIPYIGVSESEIMVAMTGSLAAEKGWKKGSWTHEEDKLLTEYVSLHGEGRWSSVAKFTGLNRSGKSCRLRWVNYLRPGLKKGQLTPLEEGIIVELHAILGNKWSTIARYLPGRTDNEIKNYWRTHFGKKDKPKHKKIERQRRSKVQKQQQPQAECEIKRTLSQKGTKNETKTSETKHIEQVMGFMQPTTLIEQQYYSLPSMHQEISTTWPNTTEDDDDGLWFSLWDFDEPPQGFAHNQYLSKNVVPNQDSFGTGGDSMQNQDVTFGAYDNLCYGKYTFG